MERLVLVTALCLCCVVPAWADRLERVLLLPDSVSGVFDPGALAYSPTNHTVYIGGTGGYVLAVDAATGQKLLRIASIRECSQIVVAEHEEKVYCYGDGVEEMSVIDCRNNLPLRPVPVSPEWSAVLAYNPVYRKLYIADWTYDTVHVLDCRADTFVTHVPVSFYVSDLCVNPATGRVYCCGEEVDNALVVLDGAADTIVRTFQPGGLLAGKVCCDAATNRVYWLRDEGGETAVLTCIDGTADTVVAEVVLGEGEPSAVCHNPANNRVYCATADGNIWVVDAATGRVTRSLFYDDELTAICANPRRNKVYCAGESEDQVVVIDGEDDEVLAEVPVAITPMDLCYSPEGGHVYCVGEWSNAVSMLDGITNRVRRTIETGYSTTHATWTPCGVYCALASKDSLLLVDTGCTRAVSCLPVPDQPDTLVAGAGWQRLFPLAWYTDSLLVLDALTGRVTGAVQAELSPEGACFDATRERLYVMSRGQPAIIIVDGATGELLRTVPSEVAIDGICFADPHQAVYGRTGNSVIGVSTVTGSVVGAFAAAHADVVYDRALDRVCLFGNDGIFVAVDPATNAEVTRRQLPFPWVWPLGCGGDGRIYCRVASAGWSGLVAIDGATGAVLDTIIRGAWPEVLARVEPTGMVYCAVLDGTVYAINDSSGVVTDTIATEPGPASITASPLGDHVYVTSAHGVMSLISHSVAAPPVAERRLSTLASRVITQPGGAADVFDGAGRFVRSLSSGSNDVRGLVPGVYFISEQSPGITDKGTAAVRKVVLAR